MRLVSRVSSQGGAGRTGRDLGQEDRPGRQRKKKTFPYTSYIKQMPRIRLHLFVSFHIRNVFLIDCSLGFPLPFILQFAG